MGCGASKTHSVTQQTSVGSWGIGGPTLASDVYGPKPRLVRQKNKLAELRQMILYAEDAQKKLPEDEHRRLMCGLAFFTERQSATLAASNRCQWALTVCSQLDTVIERELLQCDCFVALREMARIVGMDLEWCEQRWERDQERDSKHSARLERLRDTKRVVQSSAGLAFVVVLGDKFGTPLLPASVDAQTFEALLVELAKAGRAAEKLANCYIKDTNVVPSVYKLQQIDKFLPDYLSLQNSTRAHAEKKWQTEYLTPMLEDVKMAVLALQARGSITQEEADKYLYPHALQQAVQGVLWDAETGPGKKATRSILVSRCFAQVKASDPAAAMYIDLSAPGAQDAQAAIALERVRATIKAKLPEDHILDYSVPWDPQGLVPCHERHQVYLTELGDKITELAAKVLAEQLTRRPKLSDIEHEVHQHMRWLENNSKDMVGRPDALQQVKVFLEQRFEREKSLFSFLPPKRPGCSLVITGAEGCGKTKLLCTAVAEVARPLVETDSSMGSMTSGDHGEPTPVIIFRSIGFSHSLRTGRDLMRSLCLQLTSVVQSNDPVPTNYSDLTVRLGMLLAEVGESRRVIIILDGLDQLDKVEDGTPCLHWLPVDSLPDNCIFLATVSSNESMSTNHQVYTELRERLESESEWLTLGALRPEETSMLLQSWLHQTNRDLTAVQTAMLVGAASAAQDGATALVLKLGFCNSKTWTSMYSPSSISVSPCISASADELFSTLETTFPQLLVANVLGAMSIAKAGLSRAEMIDIASMDDKLMHELFKWCVPPFARVPPGAISGLLSAVEEVLEERCLPGSSPVMQWTSASLRAYCRARYDSAALRKRMHKYFSGAANIQCKPLTMKCRDMTCMLSTDRQIANMPNTFATADGKMKINHRKIVELIPLMESQHTWTDMVAFLCDYPVFDTMSSPAHVTRYAAAWKRLISEQVENKGPARSDERKVADDVIWEGLRSMVEKIGDLTQRSSTAHRVANFVRVELGMLDTALKFLEGSLHALVHEGKADLEISHTLEEIALVQYHAGENESALTKLDEVISIRAKEFNPEHKMLTGPLKLSGEIMASTGNTEEALQRYNDILRRLRGLERVEYRLLVAEITTRIAEIHKNLGERDRAIARHEEALRIRKAVLDPDHIDVSINVNALAILYENRGDLNNALSRFAEALQIRRSKLGPCHPEVASIYNNMAVVYESLGQLAEATTKYEQAVGVFRTKLGKNHIAVGTILNNLGNVYKAQGFFGKSAERYEEALAIRRKGLEKSLLVADTLNNLAGVLLLRGDLDRSLECCEESKQIREEILGKDHIEVATMLNNIAGVRLKKGEKDEIVETLCMDAYKIKSEQLGDDHVQVAEILNNIATLRNLQGDGSKALELTQQALDIQEGKWGRSHVSTAHTLHCKAVFLKGQGDLSVSVTLCKEAIAARKDLLGEDHLDVANSLQVLSEIRLEQGAHEKALENCAQALSIRRSKLGAEHVDVATCLYQAGKIYRALDRQDDTLQSFAEALSIRRKKLGNDHCDVAMVLKDLALVHWNRDMFEEALRAMEEAVEIYKRTKDKNQLELANTLNSLAALYWNQSEFDRAEEVTIESLEMRREMLGSNHADVAETLINLANVLESKGEHQKALQRCKDALDIFVAKAGSDTKEVAQLHAQMGVLHRAMSQDDLAQSHLKRSVEIFERILGADHPETLDARDILSTSSAPPTASAVEPAAEPSVTLGPAADVGWAEMGKHADVEPYHGATESATQHEIVSASQPDSVALVSESS